MSAMAQPTGSYGALVVYYHTAGKSTTVYSLDAKGNRSQTFYAETQAIQTDSGKTVVAALFPNMNPGTYEVIQSGMSSYGTKRVTIFPAAIAEVRY